MNEKIVSIYENIYNTELEWKNNLDDKFSSRLTFLITIITATFIIFTTIFFPNSINSNISHSNTHSYLKIISLISVFLSFGLCYSFYRVFFRIKKNYKVMPTDEIRMFHFYIHKNNLCCTKDEDDLYNYLNDCYQFCAYSNAKINARREKFLIIFDNLASLSFILLIITYLLMVRAGYSLSWIF